MRKTVVQGIGALALLIAGPGAGQQPPPIGAAPVKLHFYTFGGLLATAEWVAEYRAAQG